jgi:uncharacterized protein (UPF0262 family)
MILAELVIRLLVAIMEAYVEELRHATPEQVQAILARRERDLTRADKIIDRVWPGWLPGTP